MNPDTSVDFLSKMLSFLYFLVNNDGVVKFLLTHITSAIEIQFNLKCCIESIVFECYQQFAN